MSKTQESAASMVVEKLRTLGSAGALSEEICQGMGVSLTTLRNALTKLEKRGVISSHLHPSRNSNNRKRWYMADQKPATSPVVVHHAQGFGKKKEASKSIGVQISNPNKVKPQIAQTPMPRFHVDTVGRHVNPAECRPWAMYA